MTFRRMLEEGLRLDARYFAEYFLWVAATIAIQRLLPLRQRKAFLAFSGLAFLAIFISPGLAFALLGFSLLMHQVTAGRLRSARDWLWWAALLLAAAFAAAYARGIPRINDGPAGFRLVIATLIIVFYLKKTAYYLYEVHCERVTKPPLDEFLVYFFYQVFMTGLTPTFSFAHI